MPSPSVSYKRHRFPPAIIAHAVWLYFRFPLSLRLVEEMLLERGLAGGFPLSGVIGRAAIMDAADPGGLGGTYAGNPLACVAALAVLDIFEEEKLLERSNAIGARLKARLQSLSLPTRPYRLLRSAGQGPWWPSTSSKNAAATNPTQLHQTRGAAGMRARPYLVIMRRQREHDPHSGAVNSLGRAD